MAIFTTCLVKISIISTNLSRFDYVFQIIYIDQNPIRYIDPRAFEGLTKLNRLNIDSHEMKETLKLTSGGTSLTVLDLQNIVEDFEDIDLKPFNVIEALYMTKGRLTTIPTSIRYIIGTPRALSLEQNCIVTLDGMYNTTFEKLNYLDLMHNKISKINMRLLQFPMLGKIYLYDNQLKQLEDMRFSSWGIKNGVTLNISIEENPWHCDESMAVFITTLCRRQGSTYMIGKPLGMRLRLSDMVCKSPVDVKGEDLTSVFHAAMQKTDNCHWVRYCKQRYSLNSSFT